MKKILKIFMICLLFGCSIKQKDPNSIFDINLKSVKTILIDNHEVKEEYIKEFVDELNNLTYASVYTDPWLSTTFKDTEIILNKNNIKFKLGETKEVYIIFAEDDKYTIYTLNDSNIMNIYNKILNEGLK